VRKDEKIGMQDLIEEAARYDQTLSQKEKSILSAAEVLFAEKGASDTPTAEIARKAGVTERTLFRYFPSKDDLLKRVMFPVLLKVVVPIQLGKLKVLFRKSDLGIAEMFKNIPQMKAFFETVAQKYQSHLDFLSTEREAIKARINKRGQ
jgi:AcrR family transcriptional regulator